MTVPVIRLDTRELEPPEPLMLATQALGRLVAGQYLHMLHRREPRLLYPELEARHFCQRTVHEAVDLVHVLIWSEGDDVAEQAVGEVLTALGVGGAKS